MTATTGMKEFKDQLAAEGVDVSLKEPMNEEELKVVRSVIDRNSHEMQQSKYEEQRQNLASALSSYTQQVVHGTKSVSYTQRVKLFIVKKVIQVAILVCRLLGVK